MSDADDEFLLALDREFKRRNDGVKAMLIEAGRQDLVDDLDRKLKDIRTGVDTVRSVWHSISKAQRRLLLLLARGYHLRWSVGSRTRYDAYGGMKSSLDAEGDVCGIATVRALCSRELLAPDGPLLEPERKIILTDHGRFVVAHGQPSEGEE